MSGRVKLRSRTTLRRRRLFAVAVAAAVPIPAWAAEAGRTHQHPVVTVGRIAPDVLRLDLAGPELIVSSQEPYVARPGDRIDDSPRWTWLYRAGEAIGTLAGPDRDVFRPFSRMEGEPLDRAVLDHAASYTLDCLDCSPDDDHPSITRVDRKTRATDMALTGLWQFGTEAQHQIALYLSSGLQPGRRYELRLAGGPLPIVTRFIADADAWRSHAVRTVQTGFRPDDPLKLATYSAWTGAGSPVPREPVRFAVIEERSGRHAFEGRSTLIDAADIAGGPVHRLDFSALRTPGTYRVAVQNVGSSAPFSIRADAWRDAFVVSARGFLHQRSGIELGPPITDYVRPRPMHPDDGFTVLESDATFYVPGSTTTGEAHQLSTFQRLVAQATGQTVEEAWGGVMDAGDWDRHANHLIASRMKMELYELFPRFIADTRLNIPESGDRVPDLIDEALWNLDCYARMQLPHGGVRGGIESEEHPALDEASWQERLRVYAYGPDPMSTYQFAATAARAARLLGPIDQSRADGYRSAALRAAAWAEAEVASGRWDGGTHALPDARNLAAIELYRLTGDNAWHDAFRATTVFTARDVPFEAWAQHDQREAAFAYLLCRRPTSDELRERIRSSLLARADERAAMARANPFGYAKDAGAPFGWGLISAPVAGVTLVRAHHLTGDERYLSAAIQTCRFGLGDNPLNMTYTTGLGEHAPLRPLHADSDVTGQAPPPGLTLYGALAPRDAGEVFGSGDVIERLDTVLRPSYRAWAPAEAYFDVRYYAAINEFTIYQTMAPSMYVWGYLAARERDR